MTTGARLLACAACIAVSTHNVHAAEHPLSAKQRTAMTESLDAKINELTKAVTDDPKNKRNFSRRGDAYFFRGKFKQAVADYEKMVELDPKEDTQHWRRGIAYFYAGKYKKAAHQFEIYHSFDNVDRENGIWRYLSQVKAVGKKKAREGLLKYEKDDREPFPAVYRLFAGKITPKQILNQIESADISAKQRETRLFYAQLYIGLNYAVDGKAKLAEQHLQKAVANKWGPKAGFGPNYMWHVGRVHYNLLQTAKKEAKKKKDGSK